MSALFEQSQLHVAVGVIRNSTGQVLIALRAEKRHQGGLWEFPGGKIEPGESVEQALARELEEELAIHLTAASPLITISHRYPDLAVKLHVLSVEHYTGTPQSAEGQPIRWLAADELNACHFPAANRPIIAAVRLPPYYAILDDAQPGRLIDNLLTLLAKDIKLIQARLKNLSRQDVVTLMPRLQHLCEINQATLLMNSAVDYPPDAEFRSIHLTGRDLLACRARPAGKLWVGASCHNLAELVHAQTIGVDFVVLAPVLPTQTHPDAAELGWHRFADLAAQVNMPVYALGGLNLSDLKRAKQSGAQGIAGIRMFLE